MYKLSMQIWRERGIMFKMLFKHLQTTKNNKAALLCVRIRQIAGWQNEQEEEERFVLRAP